MDYKQLMKDIKNKTLNNLYLFYGEEEMLGRMMLDHLKNALIDSSLTQMNINIIDGKSITVNDIINTCETMPFMSTKRLVVVNDSSALIGNSHLSDKDIEMLCKYMENIPETTHLIFNSRNIDKKRKLYKTIQKTGEIVEYNKLQKKDLFKWINKRFQLLDKKINPEAIEMFIENSDYLNRDSKINLSDIENDILKLTAYSGNSQTINKEQVQNVISENIDTNIFKLMELIGKGSSGESIQLLDILLYNGEAPMKILFMIIRQFRLIYQSSILKEAGYSVNDIPKIMGEKPFSVNKAISQSRYFNYIKLSRAFEFLAEIDVKIKRGQIDQRLALELLIFKFS